MWNRKYYRATGVIVSIGAICVVTVLFLSHAAEARFAAEAERCDSSFGAVSEKIDCWLRLIRADLEQRGIEKALEHFSYLYETFELFGATGCHQHAHKLGDMAYYGIYRKTQDLTQMEFPQATTGCGYGFFHGFLEHLIQDTPEPLFVTETCEYLKKRLSESMRDIGTICYHGSGHGFTLARIDTVPQKEWGNLSSFINVPLAQCEGLPLANEKEIEDCREGIFNVIADWMTNKEYGFSYNEAAPFAPCALQNPKHTYACHYELGQRLSAVIEDDARNAAVLVETLKDKEIREMVFGVMVAGIMQRAAPLKREALVAEQCHGVKDASLHHVCIRSAANGMMEHGSPQQEYRQVLRFCSNPLLSKRGEQSYCYETLARRLPRFYSQETRQRICNEFPKLHKALCQTL